MAAIRARHSRACALEGKETAGPTREAEKIPGCTCRPSYSIRHTSSNSSRGSRGRSFEGSPWPRLQRKLD